MKCLNQNKLKEIFIMNKTIVKLFVYVNEVLSTFIILSNIVVQIAAFIYSDYNLLFLVTLMLSSLFLVALFGLSAIYIENNKLLESINNKLSKN